MKHRIFKKTIALLLAICLLPVIRPIYAVTEEDLPLSSAAEIQTQSATEPATILNTVSGGGDSFASATAITTGSSATVNLANVSEKRYFKFTPTVTGFYTIESSNSTYDPYLWVYNPNQEYLDEVDDIDGISSNFRYTEHFIGGYSYYFAVGSFGSDFGQCTVSVSNTNSLPWTDVLYATTTSANSVNIATEFEMLVYRFVPEETRQYVIQSGGTNGDPYVWLYNSSLDIIDDDDDGSSGLNFRLTATLTAGQTYYIAVGHAPFDLGYYGFNILMPITVPTGIYHLRNVQSTHFVDIHGPTAQEFVHQWTMSGGKQQQWVFVQQANGYYTIQSEYGNKYYIGISSTSTHLNNVKLYSEVSDATLWNVYVSSSSELILEPKTAMGKALYAPNTSSGLELQLNWMCSENNSLDRWKIEVPPSTILEGQQMSNWCWAAAARMFARHYYDGVTRTQAQAVEQIMGTVENIGGQQDEIGDAIKYYIATIPGASLDLICNDCTYVENSKIYSEGILRQFLNDGHVVCVTRTPYINNVRLSSAHAYIVCGYSMEYNNGSLSCIYTVYNPSPVEKPEPWDEPTETLGKIYLRSYDWICNGKNVSEEDGQDPYVWEGFVVVNTEYSLDTIDPIY